MRSLNVIGHVYDDGLCKGLKTHGICTEFHDVENMQSFNFNIDILLLDLRGVDQTDWAELILNQLNKNALVLMLVENKQLQFNSIQMLISKYAWDYHTAPFDADRLTRILGHALGLIRMRLRCAAQADNSQHFPSKTIMCSRVMQALSKQIYRAAPTDIPILIRGESGTGKELIAREIHQKSQRTSGEFVAVNCGSLISGVVQSELFGHEKGAFTGAINRHKGKISQAHGGTLFLDEVGDLPLDQQVNLLRFLQEGTFDAVGGSQPTSVDVRIVAATHIDLDAAIKRGEFRLDLFYRLNGLTLELPPLRDRKEDIISLAEHFCQKYASEYALGGCHFSEQAKVAMLEHQWTGNVRELINRIRRAVLLCETGIIQASDLELENSINQSCFARGLKKIKDEVEKNTLIQVMEKHSGKMDVVANDLQISRATLYRLIDKHDIYAIDS
ncbi:sigma-54-dependent transcriptional regulator [Shewanella algidipiscicola]|uniref:sigma-54-dependent transcriptional regulator n=1 Tax=Shewanella algidipiscicola TaxID=614070 RepID=UPI000D784C2D|nr:sigma-54 dependent transcriptional regulator [Shewanella algidipiscicola]